MTGVVNKFLTVAINVMIWDKHASAYGSVCLLFTILGGVLYQQSVTVKGNGAVVAQRELVPEQPEEVDEEKQSLVSSAK